MRAWEKLDSFANLREQNSEIVFGDVAELADALDLGSSSSRSAGSIPVIPTLLSCKVLRRFFGSNSWFSRHRVYLAMVAPPRHPYCLDWQLGVSQCPLFGDNFNDSQRRSDSETVAAFSRRGCVARSLLDGASRDRSTRRLQWLTGKALPTIAVVLGTFRPFDVFRGLSCFNRERR